MATSFAAEGERPSPKAEAMKQEFENARDGFNPELEKRGEVERAEDPALKPQRPEGLVLDADLQALSDRQNARDQGLDTGHDLDQGMSLGR